MDLLTGTGLVRTDMHCHACSRGFIAELDFDVDGTHVVECPHCGHEHFRRIEKGKVTGDRWASGDTTPPIPARSVWKSSVLKGQTSTAAAFIRDRWLNRSDT